MRASYNEGWNACLAGDPLDYQSSVDWRDGWLDCLRAINAGKNPQRI